MADWRDAQPYAPLIEADRSLFAWEWLRRDPVYRAAASGAGCLGTNGETPRPEPWGLHAFEDPDLSAPDARPVWSADIHPYVLPAFAAGTGAPSDALDLARPPSDALDLARFGPLARVVVAGNAREHLLLSDGLRVVRIDVLAGTLIQGPVLLRYLLSGCALAERPLLTLRRLLALQRAGRFSRSLHGREARARRWLLVLRAHDALAAGADQREIASVLLSGTADKARWRSNASSIRSQVQRLVRGARRMAAGGYCEMLR